MKANFFKSISGKLLSVYVPLISFSLVLLFIVLESRNARKLIAERDSRLEELLALESLSLVVPIWNHDFGSIQSILLTLSQREAELYSARVYDADSQIISEVAIGEIQDSGRPNVITECIAVIHHSLGRSEQIGTLEVAFHDGKIRQKIQERIIFDFIILAITILVVSGLTLLAVDKFIGRPLNMLLQSIEAEKKHKSRIPVKWTSNDELGTVVSAYNDLLSKHSEYESAVKHSEVRAKRSEAQLSQAIETMSEGFAIFDTEGFLVLCNNNYRNISKNHSQIVSIGITYKEMMEKLFSRNEFLGVEGREEEFLNKASIPHGDKTKSSVVLQLTNGKWIQFSHSHTPSGEAVIIATDITDLKNHEKEIRKAKEAADQANQAKSRFLANMSHELRTPLNAILGFSEIMQTEMMGPLGSSHYQSYASDIHQSGVHLLSLINDILDLSKIEAGAFEMNEERVDLIHEARSAVTLVTGQAGYNKVPINLEVAGQRPVLKGDKRALKQIFLNLFSNAVKFTPENGHVTFKHWENDDGDLVVQIVDTGIGISEKEIARVMEPFVRANTPMTRTFEGTGLGLSLASSMMAQHGGTLGIKSVVDHGTTVTLTFPRERVLVSGEVE